MDLLDNMREREKRKICRLLRKGEIVYDKKIDGLVYADSNE